METRSLALTLCRKLEGGGNAQVATVLDGRLAFFQIIYTLRNRVVIG